MMTMEELYRSSVGGRVSEEYIKASKHRSDLCSLKKDMIRRMQCPDISHTDYLNLEKAIKEIDNDIAAADVAIDVWGRAREICIDVSESVVVGGTCNVHSS